MRFAIALSGAASCALALVAPATLHAAVPSLTGRWVVTADLHGTPIYLKLNLKDDGGKLTGDVEGDKLEGTARDGKVEFTTRDTDGDTTVVKAAFAGGALKGEAVTTNADDPGHPDRFSFTAQPIPAPRSGPPRRQEFTPTVFYRQFSAANPPVLAIAPGDTVHTTTVDAGGADEKGVTRSLGGNPQTGPFFIEGAMPGDTLAVHIVRLKLNRDYAISDDAIVDRATDSDLAVKMKDTGKSVRWRLDLAKGVATLEKPGEHTAGFAVPVRPMLGCVATAQQPASGAPMTGDSGGYGGNMDFNEIGEGAVVYLPVRVPGALLYLGDAHAVQGDGELNGNALETSMDVEFSVELIRDKHLPGPRVVTDTHIIAMGLDGSIDGALKEATGNMAQWLTDEYGLTPSEVAEVLGPSSEIHISEAADRNAGVVLKIRKTLLAGLKKAEPAAK
jgi:acetamidase/formamidase